jgi:Na+/melibiose symporter-like transporter
MKLVPSKTGKKIHVKQNEANKFSFSIIIGNKPLLIFLSAHFLGGLAFGTFGAMFFIFVDSYLGLGDSFASVMLFSMGAGLISIKIWHLVSVHIGKQLTWASGMLLIVIGISSLGVLQPNNASFPFLVAAYLAATAGAAAINIMAPSVLSDIVDYSQLRFNANFSGSFFSLYTLVTKANFALGGSLGFFIAGWYGYDPSSVMHSPESIFGLRLAVAWLPASIALLSILFILLIPISAHRQSIISRRLNAIEDRNSISSGIE